eukprot:512626-Amorphochlora_amoeboformis.AAC.1
MAFQRGQLEVMSIARTSVGHRFRSWVVCATAFGPPNDQIYNSSGRTMDENEFAKTFGVHRKYAKMQLSRMPSLRSIPISLL